MYTYDFLGKEDFIVDYRKAKKYSVVSLLIGFTFFLALISLFLLNILPLVRSFLQI